MVELMLMMLLPPECSSMSGTAASVSAWAVKTLNVNASFMSFTLVLISALGMVPPTLLTTMSNFPKAFDRLRRQFWPLSLDGPDHRPRCALAVRGLRSAVRPPEVRTACGTRLRRRRRPLRMPPRWRHPALGGAGHHRDPVVEAESVEDHVSTSPSSPWLSQPCVLTLASSLASRSGDVLGLIECGRRLFGAERLSALEFGVDEVSQLLLIVIVVAVRLKFVAHRIDDLARHLQLCGLDVDLRIQHRKSGSRISSGHSSVWITITFRLEKSFTRSAASLVLFRNEK